ncbi:hypothetical protein H9Q72_001070 [Fusarium xylarioides]|uniref:Major facilitator superfamily (MFS) profile domain-containing protein n=1 Tax=Fusarium xylarioides TaxID=221167 RepID=A0A9P7I8Z7_9HYPO|nr:hypothetical protein H9Q70_001257 [Fusarium xylarioides]KAG5772891.1 hypothetical protein H9Q72_001070 [Fusarium xylarioides]KAG5785071.1 hypothetical protein H9Q73_001229 [Fusarium xylarioides]
MPYNVEKERGAFSENQQASSPDPEILSAGQRPDIEKTTTFASDPTLVLQHEAVQSSGTVETESLHQSPDLDFPEGGLEAWLVVLGSFCAMISVYGIINTTAVFESYFSEHQLQNYSHSEIGWIFSLYLFIVFFVGIQVGPIFDRYGPRILVAIGGVLVAGSLLILSVCHEYYQIVLAYSVMGGLGGALLNSPAFASIAHFFDIWRGFATGIAMTAGSIGGIIFPIIMQKLLPTIGFGWTVRVLGFIILALTVPCTLLMKSRLPRQEKVISIWPDLTVFSNPKFAFAALGIFFMEWGLFVPLTYIVSFAGRSTETSAQSSYTLISILNASSLLGRFLPGFLADKFGRFNMILLTISSCSVSIFGLWLPAGKSKAMIIAFNVVFGFASGSNLVLTPVCIGQLCDPRDYGRYISTGFMAASFGTLSSLPIGGAILQSANGNYGWVALITFAGISYAAAAVCFLTVRVIAVDWSIKSVF